MPKAVGMVKFKPMAQLLCPHSRFIWFIVKHTMCTFFFDLIHIHIVKLHKQFKNVDEERTLLDGTSGVTANTLMCCTLHVHTCNRSTVYVNI